MFFVLNFCGENGFEHVYVHVRNIDYLFSLACDSLKTSKEYLSCFLFIDGIQIDDNDYVRTLEPGTELFVCKSDQKQKLLIYFNIKRFTKCH